MQFTNVFKQETLFRILILMTLPLDDIRTYQKSAIKSRIAHIWTWLIFVGKQIHRISHPLMIGRCCRSNVLPTPCNYLKKTFQWRIWLVKRKKFLWCEIPNDASSVLQAEWLVLENNGKPTLNINKRYWKISSTREWYLHAMNLCLLVRCFSCCSPPSVHNLAIDCFLKVTHNQDLEIQ